MRCTMICQRVKYEIYVQCTLVQKDYCGSSLLVLRVLYIEIGIQRYFLYQTLLLFYWYRYIKNPILTVYVEVFRLIVRSKQALFVLAHALSDRWYCNSMLNYRIIYSFVRQYVQAFRKDLDNVSGYKETSGAR
jgi:hypothetical protein